MAKRDKETARANRGTTTADAMGQRVVAFAEQLGRIAGTLQAKAEGVAGSRGADQAARHRS